MLYVRLSTDINLLLRADANSNRSHFYSSNKENKTKIVYFARKNKKVVIFANRGAPPQLLNPAQNFLLYEYHIVINCDVVVLRKSKIDDTLGKGVLLVLIVHTCCPSKTIKFDLHYVTLPQ